MLHTLYKKEGIGLGLLSAILLLAPLSSHALTPLSTSFTLSTSSPLSTSAPLSAPTSTFAGTNASEIDITVEAYKGGEWITVKQIETDENGVIESEKNPPGKYRLTIDADDIQDNQTIAFDSCLVDDEFRSIKDELPVKTYAVISGVKTLISERLTDDEGCLQTVGFTSGLEFEFEVDGDGEMKKKEGQPRIKAFAKIDGSDWFHAGTNRIKNGELKAPHILPGKYKFKAKRKDKDDPALSQPYVIKATLYDEDGKKAKRDKVKLYGYFMGIKVKLAEFKTDKKGKLEIPMPQGFQEMKIRLKY